MKYPSDAYYLVIIIAIILNFNDADTTTPMTGKLTKNHILVLSDSKCNEQNPCPNNYCCLRETCISVELIEYRPNSATATATSTTTATTTTTDDILPDYECNEFSPC